MPTIHGIVEDDAADLRAALQIHPVLALEEAALRRWLRGDPDGFLDVSADDVVYFDPFTTKRVTGKAALAAYYAPLRGKINAARYEVIDPIVQEVGSVAVLTYNFISYGGNEDAMRWNCTEVYKLVGTGFRIIQTHWSFTK